MSLLIYNFFLQVYPFGICFASFWNDKAKLWIKGRKKFPVLDSSDNRKSIWMHCASLGEFEQGRTLLEYIRNKYPHYKIVVTFFSPSGYEIQKKYTGADHIFYLPSDSPSHAQRFINEINPALVLWIKYEYWYYYLNELKKRNIPVLLISGAFREDQPFFKWYGNFWKKMLTFFAWYFVQNQLSNDLLESLNLRNVTISGDTRFDRVIAIAENFVEVKMIKEFCGDSKVVVAGSTWEDDEAELIHYVKTNPEIKFIIAPHEVDTENLMDVKKSFEGSIFYSEWISDNRQQTTDNRQINCLIIDNIGMLSNLYKYADITYVGGGFGDDGLHNILEAAVYGKPVIFGPEINKNPEAEELIDCGGGIIISNALELEKTITQLFNNHDEMARRSASAKEYVYSKAGATKMIMDYIQENRLLTN